MPSLSKLNTSLSLENSAHQNSHKSKTKLTEFRQLRNEYNERNSRGGKKREKPEEVCSTSKNIKALRVSKLEMRDDFTFPVLSVRYTDPCLNLSEDRVICTGFKGWSSIFATHCAEKGKWYYEIEMLKPLETLKFINHKVSKSFRITPHSRLGWACRYQRYDMPIAHDAFGYAIRDVDGSVINSAIRKRYANKSYGVGDIIGCYLCLSEPTWWLSDPRKDQKLYEHLQAGILCNPKEPPLPSPNKGSFVEFSLNGTRYGPAYTDIHNGAYHPAISLYMGARIKVHFGPNFRFPPNPKEGWRPANELMRPYVL